MTGHCAIDRLGRKVTHRLDLVTGNPGGAQWLIRCFQKHLRGRVAAKVHAHTLVNLCRGLTVQLLIQDRFQQRLKWGWGAIQTKREVASALNQGSQPGIACFQVLDRSRRIKRQLSLASFKNHMLESTASWLHRHLTFMRESTPRPRPVP